MPALSARLFRKGEATLAALEDAAPAADILHIASHGRYPNASVVDLHGILLTPEAGDDGFLSAERFRRLRLGKTKLAVLSVCQGGLVRVGPGEEPYGLIPAALTTGVENVLTTLWAVGDDLTALWMRAFYRRLLAMGPATAAQRACCDLLEDGAPLRAWAPFVHLGASRYVDPGQPPPP